MDVKQIVVADDEPHIREVIALKLSRGGYEVFQAADGQEALELCRELLPDLVITDYQMPFLSGLDFCINLQSSPATAGIPVIMLTARGFDISAQQQRSAGITRLMSKPFSPAELLTVVRELSAAAV